MAEIMEPDESADSRTSIVSQKRNFTESTENPDVFHNSSSEEDSFQRSSKRVKQDHELLDDTGADDGTVVNLSIPSNSPPHTQAEPATLSEVDKQTSAGSLLPAMTWNKGVQSGLRTSFGAKVKPKQLSASSLPPRHLASDEGSGSGVSAEISSMQLQASIRDVHLSFDGRAEAERATSNYKETGSGASASYENERENASESLRIKTGEDSKFETVALSEESDDDTEPIYPRDLRSATTKELQPVYGRGKREFKLLEISKNGQPVSLQDLQFSDFLTFFLDNNLEKLDLLTARQTRRAYSTYVAKYYGHVAASHEYLFSLKTEQPEDKFAIGLSQKVLREKRAMLQQTGSAQEQSQISHEAAHQSTVSTERNTATSNLPIVAGKSQWPVVPSTTSADAGCEVAVSFNKIETSKQPFPTADDLSTQITVPEKIDKANVIDEPQRARSRSEFERVSDHPKQNKYRKGQDEDKVDVVATSTIASTQPILKPSVLASSHDVVSGNASPPLKMIQSAAGDDQIHMRTVMQSSLSGQSAINGEKSSILEAEGRASTRDMDVDLTDLELFLQQKYFPIASTESIVRRCLACADTGHRTLDCPALTCNFCSIAGSHTSFTCPKSKRCRKCRQRGHQAEKCPEKLLPTKSEIVACDICNSNDHSEESCHFIWRSFAPKPEEIRTVRDIAVHCYTCGGSGHYGPECGLRQKGRILSGDVTWSKSNLQKYVDLNSGDRAISAGVDYSIPSRPRKEFSIKGKANDPITLDDSDNEDVSFVRPKINQPAKHGHIHFGHAAGAGPVALGGNENRRPPNPPRASRPKLGSGGHFGQVSPVENQKVHDSARYNRERTFSPPPRYQSPDFPNQFSDNSRRYRPDSQPRRQEENSYRPAIDASYANPVQDDASAPTNSSRGGRKGRGGRGGGGAGNNSTRGDSKRKPRISKKDRARMTAAKAARQDGH